MNVPRKRRYPMRPPRPRRLVVKINAPQFDLAAVSAAIDAGLRMEWGGPETQAKFKRFRDAQAAVSDAVQNVRRQFL